MTLPQTHHVFSLLWSPGPPSGTLPRRTGPQPLPRPACQFTEGGPGASTYPASACSLHCPGTLHRRPLPPSKPGGLPLWQLKPWVLESLLPASCSHSSTPPLKSTALLPESTSHPQPHGYPSARHPLAHCAHLASGMPTDVLHSPQPSCPQTGLHRFSSPPLCAMRPPSSHSLYRFPLSQKSFSLTPSHAQSLLSSALCGERRNMGQHVPGPGAQFPRRRLSKALLRGQWLASSGPAALVVEPGSQQDHCSGLSCWSPLSHLVEAVGKRDLEPRGPGACLSSSPQAEVSPHRLKLGRCTKPRLPSKLASSLLGPASVPGEQGGLGRGGQVGLVGWPGSWMVVVLSGRSFLAPRPPLPTTRRDTSACMGPEGCTERKSTLLGPFQATRCDPSQARGPFLLCLLTLSPLKASEAQVDSERSLADRPQSSTWHQRPFSDISAPKLSIFSTPRDPHLDGMALSLPLWGLCSGYTGQATLSPCKAHCPWPARLDTGPLVFPV